MGQKKLSRRAVLAAPLAASLLRAQTPTRIIDSHVHTWTHDPQFPFAKETRNPPAEDASVEMLLDLMKKHNVEKTVIIQVIHYRWDNRYVASVLKRYRNTFHGVARVDPEDPANPDQLATLVQEQGFRGVRLSPAGNATGDWFKGPLMPPLWKRCESLKVPMTVLAPVTRMPEVAALADKYPDLTIVIDHMADCPIDKPDELEKLLALKRYPHLFVKISHTWSLSKEKFPFKDTWPQVKKIYDAFGPQRLMWATDWPIVNARANYTQALQVVKDQMDFFNADDKNWILSKTVERVWPFPA